MIKERGAKQPTFVAMLTWHHADITILTDDDEPPRRRVDGYQHAHASGSCTETLPMRGRKVSVVSLYFFVFSRIVSVLTLLSLYTLETHMMPVISQRQEGACCHSQLMFKMLKPLLHLRRDCDVLVHECTNGNIFHDSMISQVYILYE